ncbi:SRPBCC family protein [Chlorobium sp. KB01]|uniref:SRPBCC family protein n=1 Tax=Chlorobium sp. KB01 TaxID=1917528 RepID=UPI00097686FF|nr:SRPBCC family protein [Chlorobium sp. KB01]
MEQQSREISRLKEGEPIVELAFLPHDIVKVDGKILIAAPAEHVWKALTDYDNLHNTLPKVIASRVVERKENEVTLDQTGKTGIFFFEKTVYFRLRLREELLKKVIFEQVEGDFSVYRGEWILESSDSLEGTILSYHAEIRPLFFAPPILVSFVQWQDMPGILKAHKKTAEATACEKSSKAK